VPGITDAVQVAAGAYQTCARRATGAVLCWGRNTYGVLGDGRTTNSSSPVVVVGLTDAVHVSVGFYHACAIRAAGPTVCWGYNSYGQLGNGSTATALSPVAVPGLSDAVQLAAGSYHTCARRSTGAVVCWGYGLLRSARERLDGERDPARRGLGPHRRDPGHGAVLRHLRAPLDRRRGLLGRERLRSGRRPHHHQPLDAHRRHGALISGPAPVGRAVGGGLVGEFPTHVVRSAARARRHAYARPLVSAGALAGRRRRA
jgi:alpha-tubulin suppressor-like RCC1 family protein